VRRYGVGPAECSLVVTSKSCHALTAAHCLKAVLEKDEKITWQKLSPVKRPLRMGRVKDGVLPYDLDIGNTLKFKILTDGEGSRAVDRGQSTELTPAQIESFEIQQRIDRHNRTRKADAPLATGVEVSVDRRPAKILAMGQGFASCDVFPADLESVRRGSSKDQAFRGGAMSDPDSHFKFVSESRTLGLADFALLKLPDESCSCVKTGSLADNENVVVAGFSHDAVAPGASRPDAIVGRLDGESVPYAYGEQCYVFGSSTEILARNLNFFEKFAVYATVGSHFQQVDDIYRSMMKHLKSRLIVTTARAAPGSSGGAMLNSSGQLAGIITSGVMHASGKKAAGIRIDELKDQLKAMIGEEALGAAFQCD